MGVAPGCVRPARPARWLAAAFDMGVTMSDSMPVVQGRSYDNRCGVGKE